MNQRFWLLAWCLLAWCIVPAVCHAEPLEYYLPLQQDYDPEIPTPTDVLGWEIGQRHITHHELISYVEQIAEASPRVQISRHGRTHGNRPLVMLTIASPSRLKQIARVQQAHRALAKPVGDPQPIDQLPAVINMGYSVHGDESSGSNAVPLVLYHLAAARTAAIETLLDDVVILMDPCLNPDGFNRFANWANSHRGRVWNRDPQHREHRQEWPGGRVNYYWFDLNRDWLPAQHPESRGRLARYHEWKPDVVLDFHEMGTSSTYFFQPGIPERKNPRIPAANVRLTEEMATYHVKALDRIGSLYFTEERFDDFYPGKGSSYPDLHGGVGILFEQGSSRGHIQESPQGPLTFAFTIRNQVATSLSSLEATQRMRPKLLTYKQEFYRASIEEARQQPVRAMAFSAGRDRIRLAEFATILKRHDLQVFWLTADFETEDVSLAAQETLIVPTDQPEYRFLLSLLDREINFQENIFYDVSTWALDLAFDLEKTELKQVPNRSQLSGDQPALSSPNLRETDYAFLLDWSSLHAPRLLDKLLRAEVQVRLATESFTAETRQGPVSFARGTLMIPLGIQRSRAKAIVEMLGRAENWQIPTYAVTTGLTPEGIDLGSNAFRPLELPTVALLVDGGASRYEAGEIWHLFDTSLRMPLTLLSAQHLRSFDLTAYNVLIVPGGSYRLTDAAMSHLHEWVSEGGTLIIQGRAIDSLNARGLFDVEFVRGIDEDDHEHDAEMQEHAHAPRRPYGDAETNRALQLISGAIFATEIDRTHPIGYGFLNSELPLFRNHRVMMLPGENAYTSPVRHTKASLLAGYCSEENQSKLQGTASVRTEKRGQGRCILISENPNFRAFWYGSRRLMTNAVFLGQLMQQPEPTR